MLREQIIDKLRDDDNYYGDFGRQYLSNSDIGKLLNDPMSFGKPTDKTPQLLIGGYFHTAILEPEKLHRYKIIEAPTRNNKAYKEATGGEMALLQKEVDIVNMLTDKLLANNVVHDLIRGENIIYEEPQIGELANNMWKGKADIINHNEKLVIDLKTTSDIENFRYSAKKYNYDSQAYIYSSLFGYEMLYIAICKKTHQIRLYECSPDFYARGEAKVSEASVAYDMFIKDTEFDPNQYFKTEVL